MLSRRGLLKYLTAGTVLSMGTLLPFVPPLEARADPISAPKRLLVFFSSGGTVREQWLPTMANGALQLGPILAPLEAYKDQMLVIDGLGYNCCPSGLADGHYGALDASLTGTPAQVVDSSSGVTMATGISIDQAIAKTKNTPVRSVQAGVGVEMLAPGLDSISYADALQPLRPQNDAFAIYQRLFANLATPTSSPALQQRALDRHSVIDFVKGDLSRVRATLGAADRVRLEAHLASIRDMETALSQLPVSCTAPDVGAPINVNVNENIPAITKIQIDLLVTAFACGATHVATLQQGRAGALHRMNWLGPEFEIAEAGDGTTGLHSLAHANENPTARQKLARCNIWYAQQLAYLMSKLKSIPEGNGTLADSTLVLWINEFGNGAAHDKSQIPFVMLGSLGGHFKTNRVVSFPGQPHNALLTSIGQAFGLPITSFGSPSLSNGPLSGIT